MTRPAPASHVTLATLVLTLCLGLSNTEVLAGTPSRFTHQGRLLDVSDQPIDGSVTLIFQIFDTPTGGVPLWTEDHVGVPVSKGLFSVELGSTVPLTEDLFSPPGSGGGGGGTIGDRYLQVQVAGSTPLTPRLRFGSLPYAKAASRVSGDIETSPDKVAIGDVDSDGIPDVVIASDATSSRLSINTKGTGAKRYSSGGDCDDTDASLFANADDDGDGVPESSIEMSALVSRNVLKSFFQSGSTPTQSQRIDSVDDGGVRSVTVADLDGDGIQDVVAATEVTPTMAARRLKSLGIGSSGEDGVEVTLGSAKRRLEVRNLGSSGQDGVDVTLRCVQDTIIQTDSVHDNGELRTLYKATTGKSGSVKSSLFVKPGTTATTGIDEECDDGDARLAIKTKGTSAHRNAATMDATIDGAATVRCDSDSDGDGVPEDDVSMTVTPGTCAVAIKTKGTGAEKNRVISTTTPDSVVTESTFEFQNSLLMPALMKAKEKANRTKCGNNLRCFSPIVDTETETSVDTAGARLAIKTKGTSAHRTSAEIGAVVENSASVRCDSDDDGDGVPEDEGVMSVMPGTCSVAINTKGTGADKGRVSSTTTPDSAVTETTFDFQDALLLPALTKIKEKANKSKCSSNLRCQTSSVTSESEVACDTAGSSTMWSSSSTLGTSSSLTVRASLDPLANPIEHSSGAHLTPGGTWTNASDENLKENFQTVDGAELLEKINQLPITQWNYKAEPDAVTHIGPTAQDFKEAFGVGGSDKAISTIDPSGIALAAIKELNRQNRDLKNENASLKKQLDDLSHKVDELLQRK